MSTDKDFEKNISGLSFRDIRLSKKSLDDSAETLFLDEDIIESPIIFKIKKFLYRIHEKLEGDNGIGGFLLDLGKYISSRIRVVFIFASVVFEMLLGKIEEGKDTFVRKLFWGRGDFLKSSMQFISVILVLVVLLAYLYRVPNIQSVNAEDLDYIDVPEKDLFVMNATINTAVPKDRERRAVEEYVVKTGDTLSTIAQDWNVTVDTIKWANDLSSDLVRPGQKLDIPPSDGVLVTVKSGDTLSGLAKKYSANEQAIADFNWLDYPFTLEKGTQLFIPEGKMPAPAPTVAKRSTPSSYVSNRSVPNTNVGAADPNVGKFLGWPVSGGGKISQYYKGYYHRGIDIADKRAPKIVAAASGTVIFAGCYGSCPPLGSTYGGSNYAWSIQIDHGNGYTTWYAHLKDIYVRSGQSVSRGQAIGQMGSTGRSTGIHLHFEVRKGSAYGTQVNPLYYVNW
jgi:murein DD-endopeptidase MepM/ murein hydrolase activator NlpD